MNLGFWLLAGGLTGWFASLLMKMSPRQSATMNVFTGVMGALLGGWLLGPLVGGATVNHADFSFPSLMASIAGAAALLAIIAVLQRRIAR